MWFKYLVRRACSVYHYWNLRLTSKLTSYSILIMIRAKLSRENDEWQTDNKNTEI